MDRDFGKGGKRGLGTKTGADSVYLVFCGEMQRSGDLGHQPGMAGAAGFLHPVRMGGLGDEIGMGLLLRCPLRVSSVAAGAGEIVAGVEPDLGVAAKAAGLAGRSFLNGDFFRGLVLPATGRGQSKQAEKRQDGAGFFVEAKRHGGTGILGIGECSRHTTLFAAMATSRNCIGQRRPWLRSVAG